MSKSINDSNFPKNAETNKKSKNLIEVILNRVYNSEKLIFSLSVMLLLAEKNQNIDVLKFFIPHSLITVTSRGRTWT